VKHLNLQVCLALLTGVVCLAGCGVVDPGERSLSAWRVTPDAQMFGSEVHPVLANSCSAASCHGREVSFRIHQAAALPGDAGVTRPGELPEPLQTDYYSVLAYSDAETPESSLFLLWEAGTQRPHPEQGVLSVEERQLILRWLRGEVE